MVSPVGNQCLKSLCLSKTSSNKTQTGVVFFAPFICKKGKKDPKLLLCCFISKNCVKLKSENLEWGEIIRYRVKTKKTRTPIVDVGGEERETEKNRGNYLGYLWLLLLLLVLLLPLVWHLCFCEGKLSFTTNRVLKKVS